MNFRKRERIADEVSTDSLSDIMFFLMLFFLITSAFMNPNLLKLNNPKSSNKMIVKKNVTVSIDAQREFFVNKNKVSADRLPEVVNQELKRISAAEDPAIIINADKTVPVEDIVKIMNLGKEKKVRIVLQTQPQ